MTGCHTFTPPTPKIPAWAIMAMTPLEAPIRAHSCEATHPHAEHALRDAVATLLVETRAAALREAATLPALVYHGQEDYVAANDILALIDREPA